MDTIFLAMQLPYIFNIISYSCSIESPSFSKVYYDDRHVVAPFAFCSIYVWGQESVHYAFTDFREFYFSLHLDVYVINYLLVGFCLKDTIASQKSKISFVRNWVRFYVGHRCDGLVLQSYSWVLLVSYVSDSPREVKVTVDSSFMVYGRSGFVNPFSFFLQLWFVIVGHSYSFASFAQNASRIPSVGADQSIHINHEDICSAPLSFHHLQRILVSFDLG